MEITARKVTIPTMDTTALNTLMDLAVQNLIRDGDTLPIGILLDPNNAIPGAVFQLKWTSDPEKRTTMATLGATARESGHSDVIAICPAAYRAYDNPDDFQKVIEDPTECPLAYPKSMRTECILLIQVSFPEGKSTLMVQEYTENPIKMGQRLIMGANVMGSMPQDIINGYKSTLKGYPLNSEDPDEEDPIN
jgi:hypothetical protein